MHPATPTAADLDAVAAPLGYSVTTDDAGCYSLAVIGSRYIVVASSDHAEIRREIAALEETDAWEITLADAKRTGRLTVSVTVGDQDWTLAGDELISDDRTRGTATVMVRRKSRPEPFVVGTWHKSPRHAHQRITP
ncbi:hypothetical protein [Rhodococcus sovatensis]|uniref:Uncharacterized protein n=1 Tax=Rhodococcus sovatensis TaxID=1805840 RepID=A0ABZ2PKE5_9NOCA